VDSPAVFKRPPRCGVYHLVSHGQVIYVGQSVNVLSRVGSWIVGGVEFDEWHVYPCAVTQLNALEREHITRFNPPLNRGGRIWPFVNVPRAMANGGPFDDWPELVGTTRICEIGLRLKTAELVALPGFPPPVLRSGRNVRWRRDDVRRWWHKHGLAYCREHRSAG
jgi:hypothetical protein